MLAIQIRKEGFIYDRKKKSLQFSAGPSHVACCCTSGKAAKQMLNYEGSGMSVMEMSHRSSSYLDIFEKQKDY